MGYHKNIIPKGKIGEFSKIEEEFWEAKDAFEQNCPVMTMVEISDIIAAASLYAKKYHNISLINLVKMAELTISAFEDGSRK